MPRGRVVAVPDTRRALRDAFAQPWPLLAGALTLVILPLALLAR